MTSMNKSLWGSHEVLCRSSVLNMPQDTPNISSIGLELFFIDKGFFTLPHCHSDNSNEVIAIFKMSELTNTP